MQNAQKRSLTVNLKEPRGIAIVTHLVARADVFVENFRPGVADRLGLGYAALVAHNLAWSTLRFRPMGRMARWVIAGPMIISSRRWPALCPPRACRVQSQRKWAHPTSTTRLALQGLCHHGCVA